MSRLMTTDQFEASHGLPIRAWGLSLIAGVAAGLVGWLGGEAVLDHFAAEGKPMNVYGTIVSQASLASIHAAEVKNGMLAFAILGGAVGAGMGLAGGLARGRVRSALLAAAVGLGLGVAVALATTWACGLAYRRWFDEVAENLVASLLFHGAIWSSIGAAGGLAFGIGLGGRGHLARELLGGFLGGWLGTLLFEVIGTTAFPMDRTFQPVSLSWGSRLAGRLAVAVCVAIGTALTLQLSGWGKAPQPESTRRDLSGEVPS
jgi:hypothetical protein